MAWTTEQILALAPDAASAKAGQGLASARHWSGFGSTLGPGEQAVWGLCQGSGKDPYRTQIDLSEPAFRCSCPSRKFPCKHGLGLLLVYAAQPQAFTAAEPPAWVSEWLASRSKRAEQKAEKQATKQVEEKAPDPQAQAKRAAAREQKVAAGLRELDLWLRDLVRNGLAAAQTQPPSFWERTAARMVDAQAPGIARLIRELPGVIASGEGWQARLLERLAKLHLLREGYQRLESLPPDTQADIRAAIGWTVNQEALLQEPGVTDLWFVAGQRVEDEDRLRVQRTWLFGQQSGRTALILQFAAPKQSFAQALPVGALLATELVFYPGAYPLRALLKCEPHIVPLPGPGFPLKADAPTTARAAYAAALARQPWLELFALTLVGVTPFVRKERWWVRDEQSRLWPLAPRYPAGWELLALSGGHPLNLVAEWDGEFLWPLAVTGTERFVRLNF